MIDNFLRLNSINIGYNQNTFILYKNSIKNKLEVSFNTNGSSYHLMPLKFDIKKIHLFLISLIFTSTYINNRKRIINCLIKM